MRRRLAMVLVGLLVVLAGLAAGAPSALADQVTPGTAPPLRFASYNICGNQCVADGTGPDDAHRTAAVVALAAATGWRADYLFLQEVCQYQYADIAGKLPAGFTGAYAETLKAGTVAGGQKVCRGGSYGMAVFVRGTVVSTTTLTLTAGGESEPIKSPCLQSWVQNRLTWACSVHLYWNSSVLNGENAKKLAAQTRAWEDAGIPVVIGGDFNGQPATQATEPFYAPVAQQGGNGTMTEADESDADYFSAPCVAAGSTRCRSGEPTYQDGRKLDDIFVTAQYLKDVVGESLPLDRPVSDHRPLLGAASWADCGPVVPGAGGVFRIDATGALFHYAGRPDGTLAAACKRGYGWGSLTHVAREGTTLTAVDPDGALWHYPADPVTGQYSGSTRVPVGTGFGAVDVLLTPGDIDGDGRPDLVVRDTSGNLWRYPGTADGGYGAAVSIPPAGAAWSGYNLLIAAGDFARDAAGAPDLLGRTANGDLWLLRGDGAGGFGSPVKIGTGWQVYTALAAAGDVDGDGSPDLLGRDSARDLWFYRGDGAGGYAPRVRVGRNYPSGEPLF
jgi:endonuclease/exonuclease/phosphatase family metal-dependent hydrolase